MRSSVAFSLGLTPLPSWETSPLSLALNQGAGSEFLQGEGRGGV